MKLPSKKRLRKDFTQAILVRLFIIGIIICINAAVLCVIFDKQIDFGARMLFATGYAFVFIFSVIFGGIFISLLYETFDQYENSRLISLENTIKRRNKEAMEQERIKKENNAIRERLK